MFVACIASITSPIPALDDDDECIGASFAVTLDSSRSRSSGSVPLRLSDSSRDDDDDDSATVTEGGLLMEEEGSARRQCTAARRSRTRTVCRAEAAQQSRSGVRTRIDRAHG